MENFKIGDRFEVLIASNDAEKGDIITLNSIDKKRDYYYFYGHDYYTYDEMTGEDGRNQFIRLIREPSYEIY